MLCGSSLSRSRMRSLGRMPWPARPALRRPRPERRELFFLPPRALLLAMVSGCALVVRRCRSRARLGSGRRRRVRRLAGVRCAPLGDTPTKANHEADHKAHHHKKSRADSGVDQKIHRHPLKTPAIAKPSSELAHQGWGAREQVAACAVSFGQRAKKRRCSLRPYL